MILKKLWPKSFAFLKYFSFDPRPVGRFFPGEKELKKWKE
jgi:hypothetical protein